MAPRPCPVESIEKSAGPKAATVAGTALLDTPVDSHRNRQSAVRAANLPGRSEEHTSELQSQSNLVCRLLLEKKKTHSQRSQAVPPTRNCPTTLPVRPPVRRPTTVFAC